LENAGGGWWHPIHIHLESHQIRSINGSPPDPAWQHKSDTCILKGGDVAEIVMKFRTFLGPFVMHCHNLEHEDLRMMQNFDPRTVSVAAPTPITRTFP
jgi:FtsP/CotA-like multicopper oxidase with cupredoxin domain